MSGRKIIEGLEEAVAHAKGTEHPYYPGTTWAPKSGRGKPRTVVDARSPRWGEMRDSKGRPYVWWDEPVDERLTACRRATVDQFRRWAGEQVEP